jgi:hypothetical protein
MAVLAVLAAVVMVATAQTTRLPVRADGSFKIVQFADMHYSRGNLAACSDLTAAEVRLCPFPLLRACLTGRRMRTAARVPVQRLQHHRFYGPRAGR